MKHIEVRHHFVRQTKEMEVQYFNTGEMVADVLTKATPQVNLDYFSRKIGLCSREDVVNK